MNRTKVDAAVRRRALPGLPLAWLAESLACAWVWPEGETAGWLLTAVGLLVMQLLTFTFFWLWAGQRDAARRSARNLSRAVITAAGPAKILLALGACAGSDGDVVVWIVALCGLAWALESAVTAQRGGPGSAWAEAWPGGDAMAARSGALGLVACLASTWVGGDPGLGGALTIGAVFGGAVWGVRSLRRSVVEVFRASRHLRWALAGEEQ